VSEESDLICLRDEGHQHGLNGGQESEGYPLKSEFTHYGQSAARSTALQEGAEELPSYSWGLMAHLLWP